MYRKWVYVNGGLTAGSLILGRNSDLLDFFVLSFAEKRACEWVFAPDRITFPPLKDLEA